jgi:hypothetical protein
MCQRVSTIPDKWQIFVRGLPMLFNHLPKGNDNPLVQLAGGI